MVKNKSKIQQAAVAVLRFLGSKEFRYIIYAWFVVQVVFIALSTARGIAPDEGTHLRTIALYAQDGIDPFIQHQPPEAYQLGAVSRSPSYLYHYLMSFPYRLLPQ